MLKAEEKSSDIVYPTAFWVCDEQGRRIVQKRKYRKRFLSSSFICMRLSRAEGGS
jgi:hypothetical protein